MNTLSYFESLQLKALRQTLDQLEHAPDEMSRLYHASNAKSLSEALRTYYLAKTGVLDEAGKEKPQEEKVP